MLFAGTEMVFLEDSVMRFEACAWHTVAVREGNDVEAIIPYRLQARAAFASP